MFAYCLNTPVNCIDSEGTQAVPNTMRMSNDGGGDYSLNGTPKKRTESRFKKTLGQIGDMLNNIFDIAVFYTREQVHDGVDLLFIGYEKGVTTSTASGINDSPIILFTDSGNSISDNSAGIMLPGNIGNISYSVDLLGQEFCTGIYNNSLTLRLGGDKVSIRLQNDVGYGMVSNGGYVEGYIRPAAVAAAVLAYIALGPTSIPMFGVALSNA